MPKKLNLIGQKFGRLTVVSEVEARSKDGNVRWACRCDCGGTASVQGRSLKNGRAASCGCLQRDAVSHPDTLFLGQVFGRWTVLRKSLKRTLSGDILWECACACGTKGTIRGYNLITGESKSCGCTWMAKPSDSFCFKGHFRAVAGQRGKQCRACALESQWRLKGINITWKQREAIFALQHGRCDICKRHESELKSILSVDHDHKTGKIRGLLCDLCNRIVIPPCEKYPDQVQNGFAYLKKHSVKAVEQE